MYYVTVYSATGSMYACGSEATLPGAEKAAWRALRKLGSYAVIRGDAGAFVRAVKLDKLRRKLEEIYYRKEGEDGA